MYAEFFGLNRLPFSLYPDSLFVFWSRGHSRARARMQAAAARTWGRLALTGDPGVGKTLLLQTLLHSSPDDVVAAQINQPLESIDEILQAVLLQLDGSPEAANSRDLVRAYAAFMERQQAQGRKVLLLVDEAHRLRKQVLIAVLQLAGANAFCTGDVRVVLAGEPELHELIADFGSPGSCEHVVVSALAADEIPAYIEHRLRAAGSEKPAVFHADTLEILLRETGGNPRRLNILCDAAMVLAHARSSAAVAATEIRDAIAELHWTPPNGSGGATRAEVARDIVVDHATGNGNSHQERRSSEVRGTLYLAHQGRAITLVELAPGRTRIGRAADNDLQIVSQFVSRHHCQVLTTAQGSWLEDVSSKNGVLLGSRPVRRHRLRDGDVITIGDHELRYCDRTESKEPSG
jgi:type II secretory pathway predicted ATPase ExeA